jgi:hypothetical protein
MAGVKSLSIAAVVVYLGGGVDKNVGVDGIVGLNDSASTSAGATKL